MVAINEVKRLEGWMTFDEAAELLGYTKQGMHRLVFETKNPPFNIDEDVRGVGARPLMLIRASAVTEFRKRIDPNALHGQRKFRPAVPSKP